MVSTNMLGLYDLVSSLFTETSNSSRYPHYNVWADEDEKGTFHLEMALAGLSKEDISITVHGDVANVENILTIESKKSVDKERKYLYKGIATRSFKTNFRLQNNVRVVEANMENGVLSITLKRETPEHRQITIGERNSVRNLSLLTENEASRGTSSESTA